MTTIHDVARRAGVSSATVSHVMNNSRYVAPETRQRVNEAIEALRYRRDGIARSLRRARTATIGVIISDLSNPFFADVVRGIEDRIYAHAQGFNLILCNTQEDSARERLYIDVLQEKRIEGLIIVPTGENIEYLAELMAAGLPIVSADRRLDSLEMDSVVVDGEDGAYRLANHLLASGHRRIAVLRGIAGSAAGNAERRVVGYMRAMAEAGVEIDESLMITCSTTIEQAYHAGLKLIDRPDPPSAVFCVNNMMTLGIIQAITSRGLRCPRDIAVVGFDDFAGAASFSPRLTALVQPSYKLGQEAANILLGRIDGSMTAAPVRRLLQGHLVVRDSGGPSERM